MNPFYKDGKLVFFLQKVSYLRNLYTQPNPNEETFLPGRPPLPPTNLVDPEVGVRADDGPGADPALPPLQPRLDGLQGPDGLLHGPGVQVQGCRRAEVRRC